MSPSSSSGPSTEPSSPSSSPPSSTEPSGCQAVAAREVSSLSLFWLSDLNRKRPIAWNLLAAGKRELGMQGFVHDEASRGYGVFHGGDAGDDAASPATTVHDARLHLHRRALSKVLELPFRSDADVSIEETLGSLRFITAADDLGNEVSTVPNEGPAAIQIEGEFLGSDGWSRTFFGELLFNHSPYA
ncbi:catenin beta-1 [Striga asiatica]|uniref:Catenin beta-1 n=1 Tax=Striga asiatica TaxID=4170 RepID=A0A5A7P6B2_STRAF|nr:catenin beta-1 [Striga asiatica]